MVDRATPNLPSRGLPATVAFYERLGFAEQYRDDGWLIMARGGLVLEFFPFPDVEPASSSFSCCLRVDDLDGLLADCLAAGLPVTDRGWPRLHRPAVEGSGLRIGYLVDLDGTLLRLVENPSTPSEGDHP